jgi:hypothetical protein
MRRLIFVLGLFTILIALACGSSTSPPDTGHDSGLVDTTTTSTTT